MGTVGEIRFEPGLINVIPGRARLSLDVRGVDDGAVSGVVGEIAAFAGRRAATRGLVATYTERQVLAATPLDQSVVGALAAGADESGERYRLMPSGAAHDTMCVAAQVPSGMVFVPCRDGVSHSPEERADPADAALAAEIIVNALLSLPAEA